MKWIAHLSCGVAVSTGIVIKSYSRFMFKEVPQERRPDPGYVMQWEQDVAHMASATSEHGEKMRDFVLDELSAYAAALFRGKEKDLNRVLEHLRQMRPGSDADFFSTTAMEMARFGSSNFTDRQLEMNRNARFMDLHKETAHPINEMLYFDFDPRDQSQIYLHVLNSERAGLLEKASLMRNGLKRLAEMCRKDEALKDAKTIHAVSWIVFSARKLLESLGFVYDGEVTKDDIEQLEWLRDDTPDQHQKKAAKAHISVEDFLKKYPG